MTKQYLQQNINDESLNDVSFAFNSLIAPPGLTYFGGFYVFAPTDSSFGAPTLFGVPGGAYGAHTFFVTGGVPAANVRIRVTGASIDDSGVRVAADTEDLVIPAGTPINSYFEGKKWLGQITITRISGPAIQFNYGYAKYWDNNNSDFRLIGFDATWRGFVADPAIDIQVLHHRPVGWTFVPAGAPIPPPAAGSLAADYAPDNAVIAGEEGAWKCSDCNVDVAGSRTEGVICSLSTTVLNSIVAGTLALHISR
jgi:hypothetical protein